MGLGEIRIDPKGILDVSGSTLDVAFGAQDGCQVVLGFRKIAADFERLFERRLRLAEFILYAKRVAEIVMGLCKIRVFRRRLAKLDQGLVHLAMAAKGNAQADGRFREVGTKCERMPKALDGFCRLSLGEQDIGEVVGGVRRLRILLERAFDGGNRLLAGAALMKQDAQEMQRIKV